MYSSSDDMAPSSSAPGVLPRGAIVGGRFGIETLAGRGGMGSIYRARDSETGQPVALKLLHGATIPEAVHRFHREGTLLSELRHPGIVSYVAHGTTERDQPYLVMEWLEGEDLAQRLRRRPLSLSESLSLLRRAAEALAEAHRQGIVHRDIKPANLFLRGGHPEDVVVLDFGLARLTEPAVVTVTGSNTVVGSPGYMSPEQASSQSEILPSADIFSLGCVLYECLTGKPPFAAPHFAAALAKILYADPAPLHALRPHLPAGLQLLVDRMLIKDPKRRLPDATSLLQALAALESAPEVPLPGARTDLLLHRMEGGEQKLVSVLLVSLLGVTQEETVNWEQGLALRDSLRTEFFPHGAQVELLADGSLVATLVLEHGTATDQAVLAARFALTFKERWPEAAVVLVTGLSILDERLPVGESMDRAGRLLRRAERMPSTSSVVLDDVTAGLLGPGFQLTRSESGTFLLEGEQLGADASRPLLGKPTPCVGREHELALLDFTFNACIETPAARALLVTAAAGVGKSRLRHEFLRRIERKEQRFLLLQGRGEPMHAGASYGLLGQALRQLCDIAEGGNLEARRVRLYRRVALHLPDERAQEAVEFLGELCAIPFPEEHSPRLKAARSDPRLMSSRVGQALVTFLEAECAHQPVLLVLEDLHWSDALTLKLVDEVLRKLAEQPLMVLALARPEVKELFPGLWSRHLQEVSLPGLGHKAGARLVREVLGPQVPEAVVRRAVEMADGNALFLEELIRMAAEGRGEEAPGTVLAVLQARLTRMEPGARRVLLAASIFGRTFWSGGVKGLVHRELEAEQVEEYLERLVEQEVIEALPDSRFPGVAEYRFRHALVRDAAYALVPDGHRVVGHQLAGVWLEQVGEHEPMELATHYQRGQRLERAAHFYTRAAEQLFERRDLQGAMRCLEAALACGMSGAPLTRLRALQAVVAFWMDDLPMSLAQGSAVLNELKVGSRLWCWLMGGLLVGNLYHGHLEEVGRLGELLRRTTPEPEAVLAYIQAVHMLQDMHIFSGARENAEASIARLEEVVAPLLADDVLVRSHIRLTKGVLFHFFEARPWEAFTQLELGIRELRESEMEQGRNTIQINVLQTLFGETLAALGDMAGALAQLRGALADARRLEQHIMAAYVQERLLMLLSGSPEPVHRQEARAMILEYTGSQEANSLREGVGHVILARLAAADGELDEAETHARQACELLAPFRLYLVDARTTLGTLLLSRAKLTEARQVAELGVQELERMGNNGVYAVAMHLARVEACFARGDDPAGDAALREALRCVRARASDIPDPTARERFLQQVPENARLLELARQRWNDAAA
ncbi:protein kinase [Archangium violaceum]|uniref:serine/threonine-protein kinase n=1 Tax=Archangium violaceum TaxID=83451 RepID=UPI00193B8214|nr:serine/threonine-protein kinase [Archangium violaceum]QRK06469.1 protein kinase [Archangium violaceum]